MHPALLLRRRRSKAEAMSKSPRSPELDARTAAITDDPTELEAMKEARWNEAQVRARGGARRWCAIMGSAQNRASETRMAGTMCTRCVHAAQAIVCNNENVMREFEARRERMEEMQIEVRARVAARARHARPP